MLGQWATLLQRWFKYKYTPVGILLARYHCIANGTLFTAIFIIPLLPHKTKFSIYTARFFLPDFHKLILSLWCQVLFLDVFLKKAVVALRNIQIFSIFFVSPYIYVIVLIKYNVYILYGFLNLEAFLRGCSLIYVCLKI
jgi:hypothetical protein